MLVTIALAVSAVLALGVFVEALAIMRSGAPKSVFSIHVGRKEALERSPIPRIVWTYWDTLPPSSLVERCVRLWQRLAPDHEIRLVERSTASRWLPGGIDPARFDALPAYRQADWLRLQLLIAHGGIWIDGSTLLTSNLDWVHRLSQNFGSGVVGFYIDRYTADRQCPIVENWFIAAPRQDPFVLAWADELDCALALGEQGYLDLLRGNDELADVAQAIPVEMRSYLIMHLAASRVLRAGAGRYRLVLQRAEDVAFAFHAALRWRKRHLYVRLALTPAPRRRPSLIKLRSGDRSVMEEGLARGWIWRRSLLAELIGVDA